MCGISAVIGEGARDGAEILNLMHEQIEHRGPDGEGFLTWDGRTARRLDRRPETGANPLVSLGFRWLAIQDLSERACQPMVSHDGRYWLVFNGEIYNFPEIRAELESRNWSFATSSDTEVLLAAWQEWREHSLHRLEGMWAFLILDTLENTLIGARDRFGIKPLFWARENDRLLIGSEIKQIVAARLERAEPDPVHLSEFLVGRRARSDDRTSVDGIGSVPPATWFEIQLAGRRGHCPVFKRWWSLSPSRAGLDVDRELWTEMAEEALVASLTRKRRSVVRHGMLLSGGLDSSLLVAIGADKGRPVETVSMVSGDPELDETRWIEDVANRTGAATKYAKIDAEWTAENLDAVTRAQDEPLIASTLMAQYRVLEESRRLGFTVMLDGQGADEVFGGYFHHQFEAWRRGLTKFDTDVIGRGSRHLREAFSLSLTSLVGRHLVRPWVRQWSARFAPRLGRYGWMPLELMPAEQPQPAMTLKEFLARDVTRLGLPPLLLFSDRNGMAHSMEVRLPYLDHLLIELAMRMPENLLVTPFERKIVLRRVGRKYLPESVLSRSDTMGFVTPEARWIRGRLRERVLDEIGSCELASIGIDTRRALQWAESFLAGEHGDFRSVWRLMTLAIWLRQLHTES